MDQHTPQEDIAYIKNIIRDSKRIIFHDGKSFIVWGLLVVFGMLGMFFMHQFEEFTFAWLVWPVLIGIGWVYTLITEWFRGKRAKAWTFAGKILGALWFSSGVTMTLIGFLGTYAGAYSGEYVSPLIATVLGIAYLVSGVLYGKPWVSWLAVGWWGGGAVLFFITNVYSFLVFAGMMLFFQTIPGYVLYRQSKQEVSISQ